MFASFGSIVFYDVSCLHLIVHVIVHVMFEFIMKLVRFLSTALCMVMINWFCYVLVCLIVYSMFAL